jgi:hypothetical protein
MPRGNTGGATEQRQPVLRCLTRGILRMVAGGFIGRSSVTRGKYLGNYREQFGRATSIKLKDLSRRPVLGVGLKLQYPTLLRMVCIKPTARVRRFVTSYAISPVLERCYQ